MTRLIDADRLIFHSCNDMKGDCPYWGSANCGVCQKSLITRAEIDNAPTVDTDLSKYSDNLWKEAYERGHKEGYEMRKEADNEVN